MRLDNNQKFNYCWINPRNGRLCYVAYEGLTIARVEDVVKGNEPPNTRLMTYDTLMIEMLGLKKRRKKTISYITSDQVAPKKILLNPVSNY